MTCMQEMLRVNIRQNLQVVIQIATKYSDVLGPVKLIEMFESFKTFEGRSRLFFWYTYAYPNNNKDYTITLDQSSTWAKTLKFTLSIYKLQLALVRFVRLSAFVARATTTTPRKSRTSSKRPSYQISFLLSLSATDLTLSTILSFTSIKTVLPSSSRCTSSELILSGPHRLLVVSLTLTAMKLPSKDYLLPWQEISLSTNLFTKSSKGTDWSSSYPGWRLVSSLAAKILPFSMLWPRFLSTVTTIPRHSLKRTM